MIIELTNEECSLVKSALNKISNDYASLIVYFDNPSSASEACRKYERQWNEVKNLLNKFKLKEELNERT